MKYLFFTTILLILFLTACATTNSHLDEFDKFDLEDARLMNGTEASFQIIHGKSCPIN